jgi:hypothetical protein
MGGRSMPTVNSVIGPRPGGKGIGLEFSNGEGYGFVKRFRLDMDIMRDSVSIGEGDTAAGGRHGRIIARLSLFIR